MILPPENFGKSNNFQSGFLKKIVPGTGGTCFPSNSFEGNFFQYPYFWNENEAGNEVLVKPVLSWTFWKIRLHFGKGTVARTLLCYQFFLWWGEGGRFSLKAAQPSRFIYFNSAHILTLCIRTFNVMCCHAAIFEYRDKWKANWIFDSINGEKNAYFCTGGYF